MRRLVVTGYTSSIAKSFFEVVEQLHDVEIIRCGRCREADFAFDFFKLEDCRSFARFVAETSPDYLFLNHGLLVGERSIDQSDRDISRTLNVNLVSVAMVLEQLDSISNLRTLVMSSISGKAGSYDTLYATAKAGVDLLIKNIAPKLPANSRLNAISPGIIDDAKMTTARVDLDVLAEKRQRTPTQAFCSSKEVAQLSYYLLFEAENVTGENLNVNGGLYVR